MSKTSKLLKKDLRNQHWADYIKAIPVNQRILNTFENYLNKIYKL